MPNPPQADSSPSTANIAGSVVLRGGGVSAAGYVLRFAARLLVLLVAGRLFGATIFGAFTIATAVVEAAAVAGGLSTKWMLFKWLDHDTSRGRSPGHTLIDGLLLVSGSSGLIAAAIVATVALVPSGSIGDSTRLAILYLAPAIVLQATLEVFIATTRWTEVMRYDVIAKSVIQPLVTVTAIGALYLLGSPPIGLAWAYVVGTAVTLAYAAIVTRARLGGLQLRDYRFRADLLWQRFRGALPTTSSDLIDALYTRVDIYVVGILLGEHAAGIYGLARQVSMPIRQVRLAFDGMIVPMVSHTLVHGSIEQAGGALARSSRLVLVLQLPIVLLLWAFGRPLLGLVHQDFVAGYGALLFLAAAETVQGAFGLGELLLVFSRPRLMAALSAVFVTLGAVVALVLQAPLGLTGIGLSVLISYAARALCRRLLLGKLFGLSVEVALWSGPAAAVSAAVAVIAALWSLSGTAAVLCGLGIYIAVLALWLGRMRDPLVPEGFISKAERNDPLSRQGA